LLVAGPWSLVAGQSRFDSRRDSPPVSTSLRFGTQGTVPDVAGRSSVVLGRGVVGVEEGQSACVHSAALRDTGDSPGRCWSLVAGRWSAGGLSRSGTVHQCPLRCASGHRGQSRTLLVGGPWSGCVLIRGGTVRLCPLRCAPGHRRTVPDVVGRWSLVGSRFESERDSPPVSTPLRSGTQGTVPDVAGRWSLVASRRVV